MQEQVVFGEEWMSVRLPDGRSQVVSPGGISLPLSPVEDLTETVRTALNKPLDTPPLKELAKPGWRVTIAFDDPTVLCYAPVWETAISVILEELEHAGVTQDRVSLVCANALHRKFPPRELAGILGERLVKEFGARLVCHDGEDPNNLVYLGQTPSGHDVELNRCVTDSDMTIYINTSCTQGFGGGWKSICVGLSTWRSIRCHHTPDIMTLSMKRGTLHEILNEMGALVESQVGRERIFKIETVLANPLQVAHLWAGSIPATRKEALKVLKAQYVPRRDLIEEKTDIVFYGVPNWSPYASYSFMNPILTLSSTGLGYLGGVIEALGKPGCSVILAHPCPDRWDDVHHPSYREVWERVLPDTRDPYEIMERHEEEFASREDYIAKYRHHYGFHPVHGLMALQPLKRLQHASRVFVAGAVEPKLIEHIGFVPTATVEEAIAQAEESHGPGATIACVKYPMAVNRQ